MSEEINLICLPYAGGNKYSYRTYERNAPDMLNIITLEYPGRGTRANEPLSVDIQKVVNDLYDQILIYISTKRKYAIYGHSMGGLLGWLLCRKLESHNHTPPLHLFVSGTTGPSASSRDEKKKYLMEKSEFLEEVRKLKGSPDEVLNNEELLEYFEPILRADFELSETFVYEESARLTIPITVMTGTEEDMEEEDIRLWQNETAETVDFKAFSGGHFFILDHPKDILKVISSKVKHAIKSTYI